MPRTWVELTRSKGGRVELTRQQCVVQVARHCPKALAGDWCACVPVLFSFAVGRTLHLVSSL